MENSIRTSNAVMLSNKLVSTREINGTNTNNLDTTSYLQSSLNEDGAFVNLARRWWAFALAGVCLLLLASCDSKPLTEEEMIIQNGFLASQQLMNPPNNSDIPPISTEITHDYSFAWNPNNPYDSVGYLHNAMLDYYALNRNPNIVFTNLSGIIAGIYSTTSSFIQLDSASLQWFNRYFFTEVPMQGSINNYIYSVAGSQILDTKLNILFGILKNVNNRYNICNAVKALENQVNLLNLTTREKEIFFWC